ncbi:MAG: acyltransferase family protein [Vulcanimicrobiota bacterium]
MESVGVEQSDNESKRQSRPDRLLSLDALRGFTIFLMLIVNNMALDETTPRIVTHAPWNGGVYLADFVFPWFLFCVGLALPYSYTSFCRKGLPWWRFLLKAAQRTAMLVFLGCLIESSIIKRPLFSLGVLQIIGLAYFTGALFYRFRWTLRIAVAAAFLLSYGAAIQFIAVPGIGAGVFEENRHLIYYLNTTFLAPFHLKGLFSAIPTGALVLIGSIIADLLRDKELSEQKRLLIMAAAGAAMTGLSLLWNLALPFNKTVWTPSYILLMAGLGTLVLALLYIVIDLYRIQKWAFPLYVFGSNAIVAYVVPILLKVLILQVVTIDMGNGPVSLQQAAITGLITLLGLQLGSWSYTALYILIWWLILLILYKKKWFIRV